MRVRMRRKQRKHAAYQKDWTRCYDHLLYSWKRSLVLYFELIRHIEINVPCQRYDTLSNLSRSFVALITLGVSIKIMAAITMPTNAKAPHPAVYWSKHIYECLVLHCNVIPAKQKSSDKPVNINKFWNYREVRRTNIFVNSFNNHDGCSTPECIIGTNNNTYCTKFVTNLGQCVILVQP